jgi:stage V sporulation protein R
VAFSSRTVAEFLISLGLTTGVSARSKHVPAGILRSPKSVVAAFLRALFDCDGYAGSQGVILSTASIPMGEVVQQVLLNFGIRSHRRLQGDGCWHVHITGRSAELYAREIGFGLERKRSKLATYVTSRSQFKTESDADEIVEIVRGRGDVFDFTVAETHRYAAAGFVNHNSYWHSTIMTQKVLAPNEFIDYADHHSGTMATSGGRLNPYKVGIELLRDVEERWNKGQFGPEWDDCDDETKKRSWDRQLGLGRAKIFEIRAVHNDITFLDTYLTPEFCARHKLFSFNYQQPTQNYVIESREFAQIKQRLLFGLTNFGKPWIFVVNGNHRNRGELLLRHEYNGVELKLSEARDTLANVQAIWGRPVFLETVKDDKPTLLGFDGTDHTVQVIGAENDPRRNPAKRG